MNLKEYYNNLYSDSINKITSDKYDIDHFIDSQSDDRFGITLLIRPPQPIKDEIQKFLCELKEVEPHQYYYPNSDIHITIMSIISCYGGFNISKIELSKYIELIKKCLPLNKTIDIHFKGLTASNSCIMLQGFMDNDVLNDIRAKLRVAFKNSELEQSLDQRYSLKTAHSTIVRFKNEFNQKDNFLKIIKKYADHDFGSFTTNDIEFVHNDWYHRKERVKKLYEFEL